MAEHQWRWRLEVTTDDGNKEKPTNAVLELSGSWSSEGDTVGTLNIMSMQAGTLINMLSDAGCLVFGSHEDRNSLVESFRESIESPSEFLDLSDKNSRRAE